MIHTVLIVDDDALLGRAFERIVNGYFKREKLTESQARCVRYDSPLDAVAKTTLLLTHAEPCDEFHLFTDGNMPDMDGDALVVEMRRLLGKRLHGVVLMSGRAIEFEANAESFGYQLVEKPFGRERLHQLLEAFIFKTAP